MAEKITFNTGAKSYEIVDQDGNIVGEPIMGGLDNEDVMKEVQKTIDEIIENN